MTSKPKPYRKENLSELGLAQYSPTSLCGIDEVGRGPLAGPVIASAVIMSADLVNADVRDSKSLSHRQRCERFNVITELATAIGIGSVSAQEIDKLNIHRATLLAMQRAYLALTPSAQAEIRLTMVDGAHVPALNTQTISVIKGDALIPAISAASIVAKVYRDELMCMYAEKYPNYGFEQHKGYPTALHLEALSNHGACQLHRVSYKPVKACLVT